MKSNTPNTRNCSTRSLRLMKMSQGIGFPRSGVKVRYLLWQFPQLTPKKIGDCSNLGCISYLKMIRDPILRNSTTTFTVNMEACCLTSQIVGRYLWRSALLLFCQGPFQNIYQAVRLLQSLFPSWQPLSGDTETCAICDAEVHMSKEDKKEVRRRIEEEKVLPLDFTIIFPLIGYYRPAWNSFTNHPWIYGRDTLRWFLMQSSRPDSSKSGRGGWAIPLKIQDHMLWIIAFSYVVTTSWLSTPPVQVTWIPAWQ